MRSYPALRIAVGVALVAAVVLGSLALAGDGAEAPNRIDYADNAEPNVCQTVDVAVGPVICLTDAPPTPTPDVRAQRARLLREVPALVPIVEAAEDGDVDRLIELAVKANLCERRYREPIEACIGRDHVEAVQQASPLSYPSLRVADTMRSWLKSLFDGGGALLEYVARNESDAIHAMVFRLPETRCLDRGSCDYDKLVLYVVPGQKGPIEQFSFYIAKAAPPYDFWQESGGLTRTYHVLLGDCDVTPNRNCRE
jgi:hypothetical protein